MSETPKPSVANQDPSARPAFEERDIIFISDFADALRGYVQPRAGEESLTAWADRIIDVGYEQVQNIEGSHRDAEPFKLVFAAVAMGAPLSQEKAYQAKQLMAESHLLSPDEMSRLAQMSDKARSHRHTQGAPEPKIADEMATMVNQELARLSHGSNAAVGSEHYKLALKGFAVGATAALHESGNYQAKGNLITAMQQTAEQPVAA